MIKKLFGLFTKPKVVAKQPDLLFNDTEENYISFVVDKEYRPIIRVNINYVDERHSKCFAELLHLLNTGAYESQMVEMLRDIGLQNSDLKMFVYKTFEYWSSLVNKKIKTHEDDNAPYVPPLSFSKLLTNSSIQHEK